IENGYFASQIAPVEIRTRKGTQLFEVDEHPRAGVTAEQLAGMRPVLQPENGTVTPGNASRLNDGAAALMLASEQAVRDPQLTPMARLVRSAHAGVHPHYMGTGPVPAVRQVLQRTGLTLPDIALIEPTEAFAAQACAVLEELELEPTRGNP